MGNMIFERAESVVDLRGRSRALSRDETVREISKFMDLVQRTDNRFAKKAELDASDVDRADVIDWLNGLGLPMIPVRALWLSANEGIELSVADYIRHYDDLWLPGADDVLVSDLVSQFVLEFDHEELVIFWRRENQGRSNETGGDQMGPV